MKARTSRARTRTPKHSSHHPSRKIIVELPAQLYAEAEKVTSDSTNRGALIRSALQEYLEKWRTPWLINREGLPGYSRPVYNSYTGYTLCEPISSSMTD